MKLGEYILQYLREAEISQRQFALASKLSPGYISMLIAGKNPRSNAPISPTLDSLIKIASAMGMEPDELLERVDDVSINLRPRRRREPTYLTLDEEAVLDSYRRLKDDARLEIVYYVYALTLVAPIPGYDPFEQSTKIYQYINRERDPDYPDEDDPLFDAMVAFSPNRKHKARLEPLDPAIVMEKRVSNAVRNYTEKHPEDGAEEEPKAVSLARAKVVLDHVYPHHYVEPIPRAESDEFFAESQRVGASRNSSSGNVRSGKADGMPASAHADSRNYGEARNSASGRHSGANADGMPDRKPDRKPDSDLIYRAAHSVDRSEGKLERISGDQLDRLKKAKPIKSDDQL